MTYEGCLICNTYLFDMWCALYDISNAIDSNSEMNIISLQNSLRGLSYVISILKCVTMRWCGETFEALPNGWNKRLSGLVTTTREKHFMFWKKENVAWGLVILREWWVLREGNLLRLQRITWLDVCDGALSRSRRTCLNPDTVRLLWL